MNIRRQSPVSSKRPTEIGAVIIAPTGVLASVSEDSSARSRGADQFETDLLMVENAGPSAKPNRTRMTAKPVIAEPPKSASPMSPA